MGNWCAVGVIIYDSAGILSRTNTQRTNEWLLINKHIQMKMADEIFWKHAIRCGIRWKSKLIQSLNKIEFTMQLSEYKYLVQLNGFPDGIYTWCYKWIWLSPSIIQLNSDIEIINWVSAALFSDLQRLCSLSCKSICHIRCALLSLFQSRIFSAQTFVMFAHWLWTMAIDRE